MAGIKDTNYRILGTFTSDPVSPPDGSIWYNSTLGKFRKRQAGVTSDLDTTGSGVSITISATAPVSPATNDIWIDIS